MVAGMVLMLFIVTWFSCWVNSAQHNGWRVALTKLLSILVVYGCALSASHPCCAQSSDPIVVSQPQSLFNGRDLSEFTTWLKDSGIQDPNRVFRVTDGMVQVTGQGSGYLATRHQYRDYRLSLEYRWGMRTDGSKYVRNSGVLLHAVGPDGGAGGTWMTSLEVQLAQGCEGDLIVIRGKDASGQVIPATITSDTRLADDRRTRWSPTGTPTKYAGKQFWWSQHEVGFKELLDTRGKDDVASPLGQWTKVECVCTGNRVTVKINGTTVNECYDVFPAAGKILLQNESNEIFFRNIVLNPLGDSK